MAKGTVKTRTKRRTVTHTSSGGGKIITKRTKEGILKKRKSTYSAKAGAQFDPSSTTKKIKIKTKFDEGGSMIQRKTTKKYKGGGKTKIKSKYGTEANKLAPKGSKGLVTAKYKDTRKRKK